MQVFKYPRRNITTIKSLTEVKQIVNLKPHTSIKQTKLRAHDEEMIHLVKVTNSYFPKDLY